MGWTRRNKSTGVASERRLSAAAVSSQCSRLVVPALGRSVVDGPPGRRRDADLDQVLGWGANAGPNWTLVRTRVGRYPVSAVSPRL